MHTREHQIPEALKPYLQVVGRVQLGEEVLQKILEVGTNAHDEPGARVTVSACGMTNHKGSFGQMNSACTDLHSNLPK